MIARTDCTTHACSDSSLHSRDRFLSASGVAVPHDLRHYWATDAARNKIDPFALQAAGAWRSLAIPCSSIETAAIANAGVKLSRSLAPPCVYTQSTISRHYLSITERECIEAPQQYMTRLSADAAKTAASL